jgi:hypothetical protein
MIKTPHRILVRTALLSVVLLIAIAPAAIAEDDAPSTSVFHHIGTITEPAIDAIKAGKTTTNPTGLFASFDISWVDNARDLYYLADRSNNAIDVIDATDGSFVKYLAKGQFAGVIPAAPGKGNRNGPDGVVTDQQGNVWVGDGLIGGNGTSSLKAFNPDSGAPLSGTPIDTKGVARSDELAFGNVGGDRILIANPNEPTSAFTTLANTNTRQIIAKILYDAPASTASTTPPAGHGFNTNFGSPATQHGLEQPAFFQGKFWLNVPATVQNTGGELDVSDPNTGNITAVHPLATCGGTGLTVARDELVAECGDSARIIDANGNVVASFPDLGGADEIWFNPGDGNCYIELQAKGGLGVLDVAHRTFTITPVDGTQGVHSIAAAAHGNRIFMPISDNPDNGAGGIALFHAARQHHGDD